MDDYLMNKNVELIKDIRKIEKVQKENGLPQYNFANFMNKAGQIYSSKLDTVKVQFNVENTINHLQIHRSLLVTKWKDSATINLPPNNLLLPSKEIKSAQIQKDHIFIGNNILRNSETKEDLFKVIQNKAIDDITYLCKDNHNINACDTKKHNAFHYATYVGSVSKMKVLIKYNADVMAVDTDGDTALHMAVFGQKLEAMDYLAIHYPNLLKIQNNKKETPLLLASKSKKNHNLFLKLLEYDSEIINIQDIRGNTIIHYIIKENNLKLLQKILSFQTIKIMVFNLDRCSPIHVACNFGHQEIIEYLCKYLESKNNLSAINELNSNNESGAHILIKKKLYALANYLIKLQPRQWSKDPINLKYGSILHYAVKEGNLVIVKSIVETDSKVTFIKNTEGKTGLDLSLEMYSNGSTNSNTQGQEISTYLQIKCSHKRFRKA